MLNSYFLQYTYMHRKAFEFTVNKVVKNERDKSELLRRAKTHDLDKALLYTLIGKQAASDYHRANASHHMGNSDYKDRDDIMEAVIDYECAGYTKEDKPRNAYDTVRELKPNHSEELCEIMNEWGIATHYLNTPEDPEWKKYWEGIVATVTDENIMREIYDFIFEYPEDARKVYDYAKKWLSENSIV